MDILKKIFLRIERLIKTKQAYLFFIKDWITLGDLKTCATLAGTMRFSRNLESLLMDGPRHQKITIIAPHPDDEMLGPGGTLIRAISNGATVHCIYLTSGKPAEEVEKETCEIAERIGYSTEFLRFPLSQIPMHDAALKRFSDAITRSEPEAIFLPFLFDDHDEHRRASHILYAAAQRGMLPPITEIWGYQVYTALPPNVIVDISDVIEKKASAIRDWKTQARTRDWAHYILGLNALNSRFIKTNGKPVYAEGFFVVPTEEYLRLCETYFADPLGAYYSDYYRDATTA